MEHTLPVTRSGTAILTNGCSVPSFLVMLGVLRTPGGVLREASAKGTGVDDTYDDLLDDETEGVLSEYLAALVDLYLVKAAEPVAA